MVSGAHHQRIMVFQHTGPLATIEFAKKLAKICAQPLGLEPRSVVVSSQQVALPIRPPTPQCLSSQVINEFKVQKQLVMFTLFPKSSDNYLLYPRKIKKNVLIYSSA